MPMPTTSLRGMRYDSTVIEYANLLAALYYNLLTHFPTSHIINRIELFIHNITRS